jgi:hypothetical protein
MLRVAGVEVGVSDEGMSSLSAAQEQPLPFFISCALPR